MSTEDTAPETAGVEGFSSADVSDVQHMSYEQARAELVQTVSRLEAGGAGLEESLALWERGEALAARCQSWLDGARTRLDEVRAAAEAQQHDGAQQSDAGQQSGAADED